ncbi:MAG: hypothetical protein K2M30_02120 [Desulfovibrionaceae bacterium]|nr:hypothetical protein [Desulfovibrionaceae bacterium]
MLRIREQLNSGIAREVHAAHEVMYRASVVEQCLARKRYLSQHGSQSDIEEINTQLNLAQEALDQARSKYRQNVERNIVARPVLERMVRYITHSLYEEGILSLEAFVALHVVPNNGERPSRALLPSYSQVEHAKRIERQSYYRTEQVPAIRTTHSSPPPYEEAITSPPAYTIHEMTRL